MSLITATYMSLSQGGKTVLSDLDLTIERSEIVTIVGPNGSGKSTLLRGLIGAMRPSIGTVTPAKGLRVPQKLQIDAALPPTVRRFLGIPRRASQTGTDAALKNCGWVGSRKREQLVLTISFAIVVAVAIKGVGALLIFALLIIPAAAARPLCAHTRGKGCSCRTHRQLCCAGWLGRCISMGYQNRSDNHHNRCSRICSDPSEWPFVCEKPLTPLS